MASHPEDAHHFDFDLDSGIRQQVVERLEESPELPLEKSLGPQKSGVYALYYKGDLVYIGKASKGTTKSGRTLRARLNEHVGKTAGRTNLECGSLRFRYLTFVSEWWVFAAEFALIAHYSPSWNESGFGSKTPGKGRPGIYPNKWSEQFPLGKMAPEVGDQHKP